MIEHLSSRSPATLDLTDPAHLEYVREAAGQLETAQATAADAEALERRLLSEEGVPPPVLVALKLARSLLLLRELPRPVHVSVVFAVYKEHRRIRRRSEDPLGEDFLREKLRQLRWLFEPTPQHSWDLTVVDDGCPDGSGRIAEEILAAELYPTESARVLFLEDAIRDGTPPARNLRSTQESRKGGSIRLGLWSSLQAPPEKDHLALFTDADLSTHLGQIGLLAAPLMSGSAMAAIGSRREPESVVVRASGRDVRGKLFIYLWKRMVPQLRGITDTQCGFKAFRAEALTPWIALTVENGFAFDIEYLLRVQLVHPGAIARVPVAWIDSEAASTTTALQPYLPMLGAVARLYRDLLPTDPEAEPFVELVESLDPAAFQRLVDNVPQAIASRDPREFDDFAGVTPADLPVRRDER